GSGFGAAGQGGQGGYDATRSASAQHPGGGSSAGADSRPGGGPGGGAPGGQPGPAGRASQAPQPPRAAPAPSAPPARPPVSIEDDIPEEDDPDLVDSALSGHDLIVRELGATVVEEYNNE
ncbi:DNA polymerase III subunit gamma and tau, partial [Streptomyces fuscigenes]|nr:DNA polymerase III subunit gamma and tau [Streptomyces fuscigenes]